jgi:hypothetical protein
MTVVLPSIPGVTGGPVAPAVAVAQSVPAGSLERAAPEPRGRAVVVRVQTPAPTEEPPAPTDAPQPVAAASAPVVAAQRLAPAPAPIVVAPPPAACPASYFCYPRLGIAGAIVPYNDCSGATDVGVAIRQLTCVRAGIWLAGHAYTQFGGITGYRAGDVVFVRGQRFEITGASVQRSCEPSSQPIAPLSLQTSLEAATCGRVLVVQGR